MSSEHSSQGESKPNQLTPTSDDVDMTDTATSNADTSSSTATATAATAGTKLEELFDDDDLDDEEYPSSSARITQPPRTAPNQTTSNQDTSMGDDDDDDEDEDSSSGTHSKETEQAPELKLSTTDHEILRSFYQRLFPWRYLFQWLNHSPAPTNDFKHREFAFTASKGGNDMYIRYLSYETADLMRKDALKLLPTRFEIGPVYSTNPRDRKKMVGNSAFRPIAKELCFDIDMTDYDDVRTCCSKAKICKLCWRFISLAVKVVDSALRDDFGFRHIIWVYSGRRGAHAWVCDAKARSMDDHKRRAIAGYLEVLRGGSQGGKKVNVRRPLHPHISRSLDILKATFQEDILEAQNPWESNEQADRLLQLLPDKNLNQSLRKKWDAAPGRPSISKWADIDAVARSGASKNLDARALLEAKQDIVLEYMYPRLDIEVSKKLNHLLKSPFVIHPGTGRVCVPMAVETIDDFDPLTVPTVHELLAEIDAWQGDGDDGDDNAVKKEEDGAGNPARLGKGVQDWEKTSLKPYIEYFRSFVMTLMKDEKGDKVKVESDSMEF